MTKKIYYTNPYKKEHHTKIIFSDSDTLGCYTILEETIFYPEGGGQPADNGYINGVRVYNVIEESSYIKHYTETTLELGDAFCELNWKRRFDHMQQHGGQHILSGVAYKLYKAQTVGFHLGEFDTTVDLSDGSLSSEQIKKIECHANEYITKNKQVTGFFPDENRLKDLTLRKQLQDVDELRIIKIEDLDYSPCGGTHPHFTSEVGLIKVIKREKIRGNTRLHLLCGMRAYNDYVQKHEIISKLIEKLSTPLEEVIEANDNLLQSIKEKNKEINILKENLALSNAWNHIVEIDDHKRIIYYDSDLSASQIRTIANEFSSKKDYLGLIISGFDDKKNVILFKSKNLDFDLDKAVKTIKDSFDFYGGGRNNIIQGGCLLKDPDTLIQEFRQIIDTH